VLVERSHKEFPVSPDYVGFSISTALDERIIVETDGDEIIGARLE
jgi:pyrimidine operon attenuation protein/uracil phosphoribosyltransferase